MNRPFATWKAAGLAWLLVSPAAFYLQYVGIPTAVWLRDCVELLRLLVPMIDRVVVYPGSSRDELGYLLAYAWSLSPLVLWLVWGSSERYTIAWNSETRWRIVGAIALLVVGLFYLWYWPRSNFWDHPLGPLGSPLDARRNLFASLITASWTASLIVLLFVVGLDALVCTVRRALREFRKD